MRRGNRVRDVAVNTPGHLSQIVAMQVSHTKLYPGKPIAHRIDGRVNRFVLSDHCMISCFIGRRLEAGTISTRFNTMPTYTPPAPSCYTYTTWK